jgi:hypothetical protein
MSSIRTTLLIFSWSIPILVILWLLNLFYFDSFFEVPIFSLNAPIFYPYSFAIALFVALCCGAIAFWIYRPQKSDFNPLLVCLAIFIGFIANIATITQVNVYEQSLKSLFSFLLSINLLMIAIFAIVLLLWLDSIQEATQNVLKSKKEILLLLINVLLFYLFPFSLIYILPIFLACLLQNRKPLDLTQRAVYSSPIGIAMLLIYFFTVSTVFPPGMVIPMRIRHQWGMNNFPFSYEATSDRLKTCKLLTEYIGEVRETALVEDKNSNNSNIGSGGSYSVFTLELVGNKARALVKDCSSRLSCPRKDFKTRIITQTKAFELKNLPCS